jgi:hypothetical protein
MGPRRLSALVSAAGYLCNAAEDLRASGFGSFAEQIDHLIAILDAEMGLCESPDRWPGDRPAGWLADTDRQF